MSHPYRCLLILLLATVSGSGLAQQSHDPPTHIPAIARIAGIRVGYDTIEEMEQRLGAGMAYTGGHPQGAREWRIWGTHWYVDADAFDYNGRGTVLDYAIISESPVGLGSPPRFPRCPTTRRTRRKLGWLGVVSPGFSRAQVLHAIQGRLPVPKRQGDKWTWTARGFERLTSSQEPYVTWKATLVFRKGHLTKIVVESESLGSGSGLFEDSNNLLGRSVRNFMLGILRHTKSRTQRVLPDIHIGAMRQQGAHGLLITAPYSIGESRRVIRLLCIDVCPMLQQQMNRRMLPRHHGPHQRGWLARAKPFVDSGPMIQQRSNERHVLRKVGAIGVSVIDVARKCDEKRRRRVMTRERFTLQSVEQELPYRSLARGLILGICVCPVLKQRRHGLIIVALHGSDQRPVQPLLSYGLPREHGKSRHEQASHREEDHRNPQCSGLHPFSSPDALGAARSHSPAFVASRLWAQISVSSRCFSVVWMCSSS